ncbi:MAG: glycosyltransferase family 39 protein, partial [Solirubrobacteraceae bacterium]
MARIRFVAGVLVGAVALRVLTGPGVVNYDTLYSLVWGRQLAEGTAPDLEAGIAPTPHPLATLGGIVLSPLSLFEHEGLHGEPATAVVLAFAFVSLALVGWIVFALGREWFNPAAGALAAAIVVTRVPVLDFGARAYMDIPFLALVLGALLVETRRPRAGGPVLALLALAGLVRPEAWLFSAVYLVWLLAPGMRRG